jgi:hypothetical protein
MRRLGPLIYCFLLLGCIAVGKYGSPAFGFTLKVRKSWHTCLCPEKISTFHETLPNFMKRKHLRKGEKKETRGKDQSPGKQTAPKR